MNNVKEDGSHVTAPGRRGRARWRPVLAVVAALALTAGVTSCSSSQNTKSASGGGGTVNVLITSSPSASAMEALAPKFTKDTGIKVKFIQTDYNSGPTKVLLAHRSNKADYDLFQIDKPFFPQLANAGALTDLGPYLKKTPSYGLSDFSQQIQTYQKYKNTTYGLALSTEPFVLWYRTDMYQAAGLQPPTDWAGYMSNAEKLQGNGNWGSAFDYGATGSAKYFAAMLYENGGRLLDPKTNKPLLDQPVVKKTLQEYIDLAKQTPPAAIDGDSGAGAGQVTAFEQLNVGQMVQNSGWYSDLVNPKMSKNPTKVAAAPMPQDKVGPFAPSNLLYGWQLSIPSSSQNKDNAWKFMTYVLAKKNVGAFIDAGAPPPGRTSTASNPTYLKQLPYLKTMVQEAGNAIALPSIPNMSEILTLISQQISAIQAGQTSVDGGLQQAQTAVTTSLKNAGVIK